jgi:UDP-2-acetamido-3-amino-2,3-dideoxy-glucuronate N-acetyltransferase
VSAPAVGARSDAPRIHPTAIVESGVSLGPGTAVWDNVHLRGPSEIGRDCIIGEKTYIAYGVRVGDYVKINAHAYVCTGVTIEDRVMIAAGVIFTNDRYPRAFVDGVDGLAPSDPNEETLETVVRTGATIGAGAIVGPGLEIGAYAMVGMGAVVAADVPAHGLVFGTPARLRGWVCVCGTPLVGLEGTPREEQETASCERCHRRFAFVPGVSGLVLCHRD